MRRLASPRRKRSVRAPIRVEFLEDRQLLNASELPVNSVWSQVAVPLAVGQPVSAPDTATDGSSINSLGSGGAVSGPYSPTQIRHAYGVDQLTSLDGTGQTIAIVDAYTDPTIASDLATFDSTFGLPAANLVVATPESSEGPMVSNSGWDVEISLDVEWAHVIAPGARILLVEAYSANDTDLLNAVTYAVSQGADQVSMSWGGGEYSGEAGLNSYFAPGNAPGVTFLASSGDSGGQMLFPAISPYVTSVGGTTISLDSSGDRLSETAWSSGGGGQSVYIAEPSFQQGFQSTGKRTTPDVAYDADLNSGVYIYDDGTWSGVGGTSMGAPQWAGLVALANEGLANAGKSPVGSGQTFGTNSELYQLAGGTSYTNPNGDFLDITTGTNGHPAGVGYDEATGLGVPVANQLIPDLIGPTTPTPPTIGDAGFENDVLTPGTFAYDPTGSSWNFTGLSGISANYSGFTSGNPAAPQGNQVAVLQDTGSFSQSISGWSAGTYTISFDAAQRGNNGTSNQNFEVLIDGVVVSTFKPTSTSYLGYTTASFTVTTGAHTIEFLGLDTVGGDNTVFLDSVAVNVASQTTTPTIGDAGFENDVLTPGTFAYDPTGSSWNFTGLSGISANYSGFTSGNPAAPQGNQVAVLQDTGSFSQSISGWSAGTYTISFDAAQRGNNGTSNQNFEVLIDGVVVSTFKPTSTSYLGYTTASFTVTTGAHTIEFLGLDTVGGDNTVFLDSVAVNVASQTTTPTIGDAGFENDVLTPGTFAYDPTGSSWNFTGLSGISANYSGFTSGNPAAPQGNQVAVLQDTGSFSQSISGWSAGTYTISFDAAQRGNNGTSNQNFEVLIDGVIVSTFKPTSTSYQGYITASFTVTAGAHTLSFLGLDTVGGDNTVFLDSVSVATA